MKITVQVKPGSKKGPLVEAAADGSLIVFLKERAVEGAANEGLIGVVAEHFQVRKRDVVIESGFTSRIKRISVDK
ncbi:MAG: hypothetical protein RL556_742 [Actinomycetota bacterium]|jgi:uncharacterized protein YggU (UPF0235/DUF167 family)